jgi:hypothetical protein
MVKIDFMTVARFRREKLLVQQNVSTTNQAASQLERGRRKAKRRGKKEHSAMLACFVFSILIISV